MQSRVGALPVVVVTALVLFLSVATLAHAAASSQCLTPGDVALGQSCTSQAAVLTESGQLVSQSQISAFLAQCLPVWQKVSQPGIAMCAQSTPTPAAAPATNVLIQHQTTSAASAPSDSTSCGTLAAGASLTLGQSITSCNGQYELVFQTDGNVVIYPTNNQTAAGSLWSTQTNGKSAATLVMQGDGNLVLYSTGGELPADSLWGDSAHGGTIGVPGTLTLGNNGDLQVTSSSGTVLWSSNTAQQTTTTTPAPVSTSLSPSASGDSAPLIQAAITSACANTPAGTITFSAGTYVLASDVKIPPDCTGLTLSSADGAATLQPSPSNTSNPQLIHAAGISNFTLEGVVLDGDVNASAANTNPLLEFDAPSDHVTIEPNAIQNAPGDGIAFIGEPPLRGTLAAEADAGSSSMTLTAPVAGLEPGAYVDNSHVDPDIYVASVSGTTVTFSKPLTDTTLTGEQVGFTRAFQVSAPAAAGATVLHTANTASLSVGETLYNPSGCIASDTKIASIQTNASVTLDTPLACAVSTGTNVAAAAGNSNITINDVLFQDLGMNLQGTNVTSGTGFAAWISYGAWFANDDIVITGNTARRTYSSPFYIDGASDVQLSQNTYDLQFAEYQNATIYGSSCIYLNDTVNATLTNETCMGATGDGLEAHNNIELTISGGIYNDNYIDGLYITGGHDVSICPAQTRNNGQYLNYPLIHNYGYGAGLNLDGSWTYAKSGTISNVKVCSFDASDTQTKHTQSNGIFKWNTVSTISNATIQPLITTGVTGAPYSDPSVTPASLLASVPTPTIQSTGVNTSYSPWAVWIVGTNLSNTLTASLFDTTGAAWGTAIPVSMAADQGWLSISLPSDTPPSGCNQSSNCTIQVQLIGPGGVQSGKANLTLPALPQTPTAPTSNAYAFSASPNPCTVASGSSLCQTVISWNVPANATMQLWVVTTGSRSPGALVSCKIGQQTASVNIPWIATGQAYTFSLYQTATCNASAVTGQTTPAATISVSGITNTTANAQSSSQVASVLTAIESILNKLNSTLSELGH